MERSRCAELAIVAGVGVAFAGISLSPWRHLIGPAYVLRFALFTAALCAVIFGCIRLLDHLTGRSSPLLAFALSALAFLGVHRWNDNGDIDVILLHLDSLRADHCSAYGYGRDTTPRMEAFAEESAVLFRHFFAQSAGTDKSTPAMLASIYPSMFYDPQRDGSNFFVPERFPFLGQYLKPHGYASLGLSSNPVVSAHTGYARGFDLFEELWRDGLRAHDLVRHMQERIVERGAGRYFYFGLILDPHLPYQPEPGFDVYVESPEPDHLTIAERVRGGEPMEPYLDQVVALYDGEIREVDDAVGTLIDWLERTGRLGRTMLILTSDHGEKLLEHGEYGHGGMLYEEVLHVPLIWSFPSPIRFPPVEPAVRVHEPIASHVDLVPTILGFLGRSVPGEHVRGRNLIPLLFGKAAAPERAVLSEELTDGVAIRSLRSARWKTVTIRSSARDSAILIDLGRHPGEDAAVEEGEEGYGLLGEMAAEITSRVEGNRRFYRDKEDLAPLDDETMERLRELGYL